MPRRGRPPVDDLLTPAQWEVLHLVRHGVSNRRIAELRGTSLDAVKTHIEHARDRLGIATRDGLRFWPGVPQNSALRSSPMSQAAASSLALSHIGQIAIIVTDIERSVAFYRDILGIRHLFTAGDLAFLDAAGTRLMLDALPEARDNGTSTLYFSVDDIHGACTALEGRGLQFTGAPHMIYRHPDSGIEEWMAFFADPDGNTLALMSAVSP